MIMERPIFLVLLVHRSTKPLYRLSGPSSKLWLPPGRPLPKGLLQWGIEPRTLRLKVQDSTTTPQQWCKMVIGI